MKAIFAVLAVFVTLPLWLFLLYKILVAVNATELMWFVYCIYVPVTIITAIIGQLVSRD